MIPFSRIVTVKRQSAGSYSDATGLFEPGSEQTMSVAASVQPMTARDLLLLEEADRTREWIKLYSEFKFHAGEQTAGGQPVKADVIIYNNERYVVRSVTDWTMQGGVTRIKYFRANAVRADGDQDNAT